MNTPLYKNINLYIIFAITLGGIVGVSILVPVLPEIARQFSLSPAGVGLVITMYTLPGVLFVLFLGILADKFGRKTLIILSLLIFSLAGGYIYWLDDYFWVTVFRFIQGIGGAVLPSMGTILIGDLFDDDVRLKVLGMNAAVLSTGAALFPLVGGTLATIGWNVPFLTFWFGILLAVFIAVFFKEPKIYNTQGIIAYFKGARKYLITKKTLLAFLTGFIIFIILFGGLLTYLPLYMDRHFSMSSFSIGIFIAASSCATIIIGPFASTIEKKLGRRNMLVFGFLLLTTALASIYLAPSKYWLLGTFVLFGSSMAMNIPVLNNIVTELSPREYRGFMVSFYGMMIRLGQTLGPPLLALVLFFGELELVFPVCALLAGFFAILLFFKGSIFSHQ